MRSRAIERAAWRAAPERPAFMVAVQHKQDEARARGLTMIVKPFDGPVDGVPGYAYLVAGLERDEPVFVVRARDALALTFLTQYAATTREAGLFGLARTEQLALDIAAFTAWRRAHSERVRDPD